MGYDIEDLKKLVESDGWKFYCSEVEKLISAQTGLVEVKSTIEEFLSIKHKVLAYKMAIELPHVLIERESPT